jgi:hypothetical protein
VSNLRSFGYACIVITKYKITTLLIFLNVDTYALYSTETIAVPTNFPFYMVNDQLHLSIHPRSDDVKRP